MALSKKHFEMFARALAAHRDDAGEYAVRVIARSIADICESENERFDRARFMAACFPPECESCGAEIPDARVTCGACGKHV
jgi:hypothetical protein